MNHSSSRKKFLKVLLFLFRARFMNEGNTRLHSGGGWYNTVKATARGKRRDSFTSQLALPHSWYVTVHSVGFSIFSFSPVISIIQNERWNGTLDNGGIFRNFFFRFDDELFEYSMHNSNNIALCHDHWT